jgi:hypothetical protein
MRKTITSGTINPGNGLWMGKERESLVDARLFGQLPCENPCEKNSPKSAKTGKNRKKPGNQNSTISNS